MLPFIVFISKGGDKCLNCIVEKNEIISDEKHLLDITSSEVKPSWTGLVLGWVTTFKQKLLC